MTSTTSGQIQGFFDIPTETISTLARHGARYPGTLRSHERHGGVARRRRRWRARLRCCITTPLAIIDKRRERAGESEVMNVIGDAAGYTCILIDDIVDPGGTLVNADALIANGAKDVYVISATA